MPGENFSRRVARAAAVGGGRTYRGQTPVGWYAILLAICVVGIGLVAYSRYERTHPKAAVAKPVVQPTKANQWQVGLDLDICGKIRQLPASTAAEAFTIDGHGVLNIEPGLASDPTLYSGNNAVLNSFLIPAEVILTDTSLQIPRPVKPTPTTTTTSTTSTSSTSTTTTTAPKSSTTSSSTSSTTTTTTLPPKPEIYKNGETCQGKKAIVQVMEWASPSAKTGTLVTKTAASLKFKDGQLITIAFLPTGATIPKPTSAHVIAQFLLSNPHGIASNLPATVPSTSLPVVPSTSAPTTTVGPSVTSTTAKAKS